MNEETTIETQVDDGRTIAVREVLTCCGSCSDWRPVYSWPWSKRSLSMETNDIPAAHISDWQPITDKHDLAVLGKLGEEVNELGSALFRCVIQGLDECEPTTHKINRSWLEDEIADVLALAEIAMQRLDLNRTAIADRIARKITFKEPWFESLKK